MEDSSIRQEKFVILAIGPKVGSTLAPPISYAPGNKSNVCSVYEGETPKALMGWGVGNGIRPMGAFVYALNKF